MVSAAEQHEGKQWVRGRVAVVFAGAGLPRFILRQQDERLVLLQDAEADGPR